jgi:PAS domain S-box-containing protein
MPTGIGRCVQQDYQGCAMAFPEPVPGADAGKPGMKSVYIIAWLMIVVFLGWSSNLLWTIQSHWTETNRLHLCHDALETLAITLGDLNRPGNDVLENYEVTRNRAAFEEYLRRYLSARDAVSGWARADKQLEPLIQGLEREQAALSGQAREILELAGEREKLRLEGAAQDLVRSKEMEAAARMARMDQAFQNGLDLILQASSRVVDREQSLEYQQQRNFKLLYVMLLGALVASALSVELLRRTIRQREALRESSARISAIVNNVVDGIITVDESGRIGSINPPAASMFGCTGDAVIGREFPLLLNPDCRGMYSDQLRDSVGTVIPSFFPDTCENAGRRQDGSCFPIELAASRVMVNGRQLLVHIVRDISERKQVEENLRQAAVVFENITEGIVVTDAQGTIQSVNPAFTRITLYPGEEVIGRNPRILQSGRHDRQFYEVMWATLLESGRWQGEIWNRRRNGEIHPQWLNISAIQDDRGRTTNYIGVTWDITELKAAEHKKEEFMAAVSHELRTPLTSVLASLGLLMQGDGGPMPERAQTLVRMAYSNSGRLVRLIGDILDIERMEAGEMQVELKPLELMPLVEKTIESSSACLDQLASGVGIVLVESLPGVRVSGDAERLMQALANLLSNAGKFSPPGDRVEIAVSQRGAMVRIAVTDHGPGIPEAFRPEVFKKFAQADGTKQQHKGGMGLGLSITRHIVGKHGGRIDYESLPGVRTTFFIELPGLPLDDSGNSGAEQVI